MDPSPTRGACQARGEIETGRTREEQQMGDMTAEKKGLFIAIFLIGREIRVLSAFFFSDGGWKGDKAYCVRINHADCSNCNINCSITGTRARVVKLVNPVLLFG